MAGKFEEGECLPDGARIECIACGDSLFYLPEVYPLAFHCGKGHFFTLSDLLDELLSNGKSPLVTTLEHWHRNSHLLRRMARRALEIGHAFKAADIQEAADRIDQWAQKLSLLLPGAGSGPVRCT